MQLLPAIMVAVCDGDVIAARDGLPDLVPLLETCRTQPETTWRSTAAGAWSSLHLQQGSVAAEAGDVLQTGGEVGRVG